MSMARRFTAIFLCFTLLICFSAANTVYADSQGTDIESFDSIKDKAIEYINSDSGKQKIEERITEAITDFSPIEYDNLKLDNPFNISCYYSVSNEAEDCNKYGMAFGIYSENTLVGALRIYFDSDSSSANCGSVILIPRYISENSTDTIRIFYYNTIAKDDDIPAGYAATYYAINQNDIAYPIEYNKGKDFPDSVSYSSFDSLDNVDLPLHPTENAISISMSADTDTRWYITDGSRYLTRTDDGYTLSDRHLGDRTQQFTVENLGNSECKVKNCSSGQYIAINNNSEFVIQNINTDYEDYSAIIYINLDNGSIPVEISGSSNWYFKKVYTNLPQERD